MIAATHDPLMIEHVERIVEMEDGALVGQSEVGQSEEAAEEWSRPG